MAGRTSGEGPREGRDDSAHRIASLHDAEDDEAEAPEDRTALISTAAMDTLLAESKDDVTGNPKATPLVPASPEALQAAPPQGSPALRPVPRPAAGRPAEADLSAGPSVAPSAGPSTGKGRGLVVVIALVLIAAAGALAYKFSQAGVEGGGERRLVFAPPPASELGPRG